jgi:glycosyltransferase involved in cell wall biosynthesis
VRVVLSIDSVHFPLTGIGRYTFELARNLPRSDPELALTLMRGGRFLQQMPEPRECGGAGPDAGSGGTGGARRMLGHPWVRNRVQRSPLAISLHRRLVGWRQARLLRPYADAVYHGPNFYLPRFAGPSVVTIHDLSVFAWAHCHPRGRVKVLQDEIARSVRRADLILTDSEFTRREVAGYFGLPEARVRAVALGSAPGFAPRSPAALAPLLQRWSIEPEGYCLYAGTIEPRKNLDALLDAYQALPAVVRDRWPLVLCGYEGWQSGDLHARMSRAARDGWLKYLGYVADEHLPLLFAGARLFAYPSLYEGFGLPVLEAMASGVPVVCSDSASLPEVVGDAGALCAAEDVDGLRSLLHRGLEDEAWRVRARERGLARARSFSWRRCARETFAAYQSARAGAPG